MAYGIGDLWDSTKKYGKYVNPVALIGTEKAINFAKNLYGATSGDAPQINGQAVQAFADNTQANTPMGFGGVAPTVTAPAAAGLIGSYQDTINGSTPSLALAALQRQTGNNMSNAFGNAAAGVTGGNALLALRDAQHTAAGQNQDAAGQAAMLRAQEIAQAQQGLGTALQAQLQAQNAQKNFALEAFKAPLDVEAKNKAARAALNGQTLTTAGQLGSAYLGSS